MRVRLKVREVAKEKGMSKAKLGRVADIDVNTMKRIYRDPFTTITTPTLARLATALDVDPSELIEGAPDKTEEE